MICAIFCFSYVNRLILYLLFWDFLSLAFGLLRCNLHTMLWNGFMVQFREFSLLLYNHHHSKNMGCFSQNSFMPLWSQPFPQIQDMANIDLYMRLTDISWKLFYGNGKNGINSSDFCKIYLYYIKCDLSFVCL